MVTPFPPQPDGIAAYAVQTVRRLRSEGHTVEVLSPGPSAAHHHLALQGPRGALALAKRVRSYDRVVIQFHPDFFYSQPMTPRSITRETLALCVAVMAAHSVEARVHEIDYRWGHGRDTLGWANRRLWRRIDAISVHTARERADFIDSFRVHPDRIAVVDHGSDFVANTSIDKGQARATLGIPDEVTSFLSIGFIQRHKGFDRAVRAFGQIGAGADARLDVVGAIRVEDATNLAYHEELQDLTASVPGAHLHAGFLSDETFDRWIVASDVVVLPYREIWSSSVLERAILLGRPVIATDVGGLRDQAGERDGVTVVTDDAELAGAMARAMGSTSAAPTVGSVGWPTETATHDQIQARVLARAASRRGYAEPLPEPSGTMARTSRASSRSIDALRQLPGLPLASPSAGRRAARPMKRLIRRLTGWQVDPVVHQVNAIHRATTDALDELRRTDDQRGRTATSRTSEPPGK